MRRKGSSCIFIYVFYSFILETHLLELNIEYEWRVAGCWLGWWWEKNQHDIKNTKQPRKIDKKE